MRENCAKSGKVSNHIEKKQNAIRKITTRDITEIAMMVAIIEVCKVVLMGIANVELTSFWIIMFTLFFGSKIFLVIPVFILLEGIMFGFGLWWIMYLYAWPLLAILTRTLRKMESVIGWSVLSGLFGLSFGFLCSLPNIVIGAVDGNWRAGFIAAFNYFIAGIPFDVIHCAGNFVIMLVLYYPVRRVMKSVKKIGNF